MYNLVLAFTSFGAKVDESVTRGTGPYSFRIQGEPNCFLHCKIWSTEQADAVENVMEDHLVDHEVIADLQSQIQRFRYRNPMDIKNLLNYPEEQITSYTPYLDSIIEDHLEEAGLVPVLHEEEDDIKEVPAMSAAAGPNKGRETLLITLISQNYYFL